MIDLEPRGTHINLLTVAETDLSSPANLQRPTREATRQCAKARMRETKCLDDAPAAPHTPAPSWRRGGYRNLSTPHIIAAFGGGAGHMSEVRGGNIEGSEEAPRRWDEGRLAAERFECRREASERREGEEASGAVVALESRACTACITPSSHRLSDERRELCISRIASCATQGSNRGVGGRGGGGGGEGGRGREGG